MILVVMLRHVLARLGGTSGRRLRRLLILLIRKERHPDLAGW